MSQSATLYRVSQDSLMQLTNSVDKQQFDIRAMAKGYSIFAGTFMGLTFILSKGQNTVTAGLVSEIFEPKRSLLRAWLDDLSPEAQMAFWENDGSLMPYLDFTSVAAINDILYNISEADIKHRYDAQELNNNGIYPDAWHNDNSPDLAYNERHFVNDFKELKFIFNKAYQEKDCILVFVG
jgi:hypothetical protein